MRLARIGSGGTMTMKPRRIRIGEERGQSMTEFAVVLPILVVLLFGIVQFGILFNNYVTLTDAARAGARAGAVSRQAPSPSGAADAAVRASASDLNQGSLGVNVSSSWSAGSPVTVTATYPYSINLLGWVITSGNLTTSSTEAVE
jgi:Flp pilus assembly protein TadG